MHGAQPVLALQHDGVRLGAGQMRAQLHRLTLQQSGARGALSGGAHRRPQHFRNSFDTAVRAGNGISHYQQNRIAPGGALQIDVLPVLQMAASEGIDTTDVVARQQMLRRPLWRERWFQMRAGWADQIMIAVQQLYAGRLCQLCKFGECMGGEGLARVQEEHPALVLLQRSERRLQRPMPVNLLRAIAGFLNETLNAFHTSNAFHTRAADVQSPVWPGLFCNAGQGRQHCSVVIPIGDQQLEGLPRSPGDVLGSGAQLCQFGFIGQVAPIPGVVEIAVLEQEERARDAAVLPRLVDKAQLQRVFSCGQVRQRDFLVEAGRERVRQLGEQLCNVWSADAGGKTGLHLAINDGLDSVDAIWRTTPALQRDLFREFILGGAGNVEVAVNRTDGARRCVAGWCRARCVLRGMLRRR